MIGATRATGSNPSKFANKTFKGNSFFLNKTQVLTNFLFWGQLSFHLDQSWVPAVCQILKNALFPITCKRPWSPLGTWGTLTSRRTCITLLSSLTRGALWSLEARGTCITLASEWASWSSRSRVSWDARYPRCAETRRETTGAILWILLRKLRAEINEKDQCIIHSLWFGVNALGMFVPWIALEKQVTK